MFTRLLQKIRYLRHPYLIVRAIRLHFSVRYSKKYCTRLSEYTKYSVPFEKSVEALTGIEKSIIRSMLDELASSKFFSYIRSSEKQIICGGGSPIDDDSKFLIYMLTRFLRPKVVVETGVANGFSSAIILKALNENTEGTLHSIDLHYRDGLMVPSGKSIGWVIPNELRNNWCLHLGESIKVLPKLLPELRSIDIFFHDSRHTYKTMMNEFKMAWKYLKKGGLLLSDDCTANDAFLDFADLHKQVPIVWNRLGVIHKKS